MTSPKPTDYKPLTRAQEKLLDAAEVIWAERGTEKDAAFMARQLVQATLPHTNPGSVPIWTRTNGDLTLAIQPGFNIKSRKSYGYPYGIIPRLLLFWMTSEAVRTKSRRLELGHSLSRFMNDLGLSPATGGGPRSDARRLREQMERLFRARISFEATLEREGRTGEARRDMLVAEESMLWWDHKNPQQDALWGSWIELGQRFYEAITATPVPVDMRALKSLKRSPLALDLYAWLTYEAWRSNRSNSPRFVSWQLLHAQFGAEYSGEKAITNFQQAARKALIKIKQVYPDLVLGTKRGGIEILPGSLPAIRSRT
jgi:hypothetical protein